MKDTPHHVSMNIPISKGLMLINSFSGLIARIVNLGMLVWLQQYLLIRISPEEYSLYPVFTSILMFMLIAKSIFTGGIARYLIAARSRGDNVQIERIVSSTFALNAAIACIVFVVGIPISMSVERLLTIDPVYHGDAHRMMLIMVTSFALRLAFASFESGLIVEQRFVIINVVAVGASLLRFGLLLIFVIGVSPRILWVALATEVVNILRMLVTSVLSARALPYLRFRRKSVNWGTLKQILSFGSWSFFGQIANKIRIAADPVILNQLAGPLDVTFYYLGSLVPKNAYSIVGHVTQVLLPSLTAMYETGQHTRLANAYLRYGRVVTWILFSVAIPFIILSGKIMTLYAGTNFISAGTVLAVLFVADIFELPYSAVPKIAFAAAKMKVFSLLSAGAQSLNLLLTLTLVGFFNMGAFGAALSTLLIRVFVELPIFSVYGAHLVGIPYRKWVVSAWLRGILPGLSAALAMLIVKVFWSPDNWLSIIAQAAMGVIAFILAAFFIAAEKIDRADALRLLKLLAGRITLRGKQV